MKVTFVNMFESSFSERPSLESQESALAAIDRMRQSIRDENAANQNLLIVARQCDSADRNNNRPQTPTGATVQLLRLPMLPEWDYREAHFAWLISSVRDKGYGSCVQFTSAGGQSKSYEYFWISGRCRTATSLYNRVDHAACDRMIGRGRAGFVYPAISYVPKASDETLEQKRLELLSNPPTVVLKPLPRKGMSLSEAMSYCATANY